MYPGLTHAMFRVLLLTPLLSATAHAELTLRTIALAGQPAPGIPDCNFATGAGPIFGPVYINNRGEVAFWARLAIAPSNEYGIWVGEPGALAPLARTGDPVPQAPPGSASLFLWPYDSDLPLWLSDTGEVAFWSCVHVAGAGSERGIFIGRPDNLRTVVRDGDPVPGMEPLHFRLGWQANCWARYPFVLSQRGQLALYLAIADAAGNVLGHGIWSGAAAPLEGLMLEGDPAPDTGPDGVFDSISDATRSLSINSPAEVAFVARYDAPGVEAIDDTGVWGASGAGTWLTARGGQPAPDLPGLFLTNLGSYDRAALNDAGYVAVRAELRGVWPYDRGIWAGRSGEMHLVLRTGTPVPGPPGAYVLYFEPVIMNRNGQLAFGAILGSPSVDALCVGYVGRIRVVAWEGMQAPGLPEGVVFGNLAQWVTLNRRGQGIFSAWLTGPGVTPDYAVSLWAANPDGSLMLIACESQSVEVAPGDVRVLIDIFPAQDCGGGEDGHSRILNDNGRLVFAAAVAAGPADRLSDSNVVFAADVPLSSPATGDADEDGDVDVDDLQAFAAAMTPVDAVPQMPPSEEFLQSAEIFDFDADGDLDLVDFSNLAVRR